MSTDGTHAGASALAAADVGCWRWDADQQTLSLDSTGSALFGFQGEPQRLTWSEIVARLAPGDRLPLEEALRDGADGQRSLDLEVRLPGPGDQARSLRLRGGPEAGPGRTVAGLVERLSAEAVSHAHLTRELRFQELLMEANEDLVFVKDEAFRIVRANQAFLNLYPPEQRDRVVGTTTVEEYDEAQAEEFLAEDRKAFAEGFSEVVEVIDFPDGNRRALLTKKTRFEDAAGRRFLLGVARDITQIKQTEAALLRSNEELEEFAYRTSHDLRSPLVSAEKLLELSERAIEADESDTALKYVTVARRSLRKVGELVTDILQLTKLDHNEGAAADVDLEALVRQTADDLEHVPGHERVRFEFRFGHHGVLRLREDNVTVIARNLISNAIKYHDPEESKPYVRVTTSMRGNRLLLAVEDNGLGVPPAGRADLFKMFRRFHAGSIAGSGLGLYMTRKSAEKIGGEVAFHALAKGTRFDVELPVER